MNDTPLLIGMRLFVGLFKISVFWNFQFLKASMEGHADIAKLLIEKGANVNHRNVNGSSALIYGISVLVNWE